MDIIDAAYHTAHDYPGGCASLAPRMGISKNVLQNKVNPSQEFHKLSLAEAMQMQVITGDKRIINAMAEELGGVFVEIGAFLGISDQALLDLFTEQYAALGKFSGDFKDAFADGVITQDERCRLRGDVYKINQVLSEILARIDAYMEASESKR